MALLRFLKKDANARKIFGKRELKIIEKQLLGVNLTQSEKNRLSRDIRKKFEFIKEASKFEKEFGLKKGSIIKELIGEAKGVILESEYFPRIKKIILFGSAVENKLSLRSDIDLAVIFDDITTKDAGKFRVHTLGEVNDRIDVQVYNALPKKIKNEIDKKGRVLYEKRGKNGEK